MKKYRRIVTVALLGLLLLSLSSGCMVTHDSPAPGCVKYVGIAPLGGCNGKTIITDLVEPGIECLEIEANNCNGGILEVHNNCTAELVLGEIEIAPGESSDLDVAEKDGKPVLVQVWSNFSEYVPETDEKIEVAGTLGEREIRIEFTKTSPLCE